MKELKKIIREVPDFPKEGILFYDITTLLRDAGSFSLTIDKLYERYADKQIDLVLAIDARGFIFGSALAYKLGTGLILVRKAGKLPYKTKNASYSLEYGTDEVEMHEDAVDAGQKILIVDDLLATGGTASAAVELVEKSGGEVAECCFIVELTFLKGRDRLQGTRVFSLIEYDE